MPDVLGRYTLLEMREMVRRCLDAIRPDHLEPTSDNTVVPEKIIGAEVAPLEVDPLYSNQDLNFFINSAITSTSVDMMISSESVLADEELINVEANRVEYPLPDDAMLLKGLYWKPPHVALSEFPPSRRIPMDMIDEPGGPLSVIRNGAPTFRRQLNQIVLNEFPRLDNPGGILARYIKPLLFLSDEGGVLETEFARVMQEVVIRRAAKEAATKRAMVISAAVDAELKEWEQRLTLVVMNATAPSSVQLVTPIPAQRRRGRFVHVA